MTHDDLILYSFEGKESHKLRTTLLQLDLELKHKVSILLCLSVLLKITGEFQKHLSSSVHNTEIINHYQLELIGIND